ncbi:cyclin, partial [Aureobasidium sp. EXF-8845]
MYRRNNRPVCRMWQMGRCTLNSIQCEFRHSDPSGSNAQLVLQEAFAPRLRTSSPSWSSGNHNVHRDRQFVLAEGFAAQVPDSPDDFGMVHRDRQPLQEIVLPASLTEVHGLYRVQGERDQSNWESPRSSPQRWANGEIQPSAFGHRSALSVGSQNDAIDSLRTKAEDHEAPDAEHEITICEDQEEFQERDADGSAPMSESDSEDEISRLARINDPDSDEEEDDKENDLPVIMPRVVIVTERERQRRRSRFDIAERTDARLETPSPSRSFISASTNPPSRNMSHSREMSQNGGAPNDTNVGPHPSFIQVANPYIFQQQLQSSLNALGATEHKEDSIRLQGVHYIDSVRKALQLPVRTFNTAVVYYHKFRLVHSDSEYMWADAAAAALFTACKIEDTLKKSREVLCAAWNLKLSSSEHLSPDDPVFEQPSKTVVGIERLMLESAGFDFRTRHPQELVVKLVRERGLPKEIVGRTAYNMSIDLYRTFAPLKQTSQTMAISCVELTARLLNLTTDFNMDTIVGPDGISLERWSTTRGEIMETLLDLLD